MAAEAVVSCSEVSGESGSSSQVLDWELQARSREAASSEPRA